MGLVLADVFITTLAPRGTGSVTEKVRAWLWKFFHWICGGRGINKLLNYAGMVPVSAWLLGWLLMLWVGCALILISNETSVVVSSTKITATALEKIYFWAMSFPLWGLVILSPMDMDGKYSLMYKEKMEPTMC